MRLGSTGPDVFPLGLGCMAMSGTYGATDDAESIATIRHAIDRGFTLLDTGDFYGMGHNELLVRRGLLTGSKSSGATDMRQYLPRFAGDNGVRNAAVVDGIHRFAAERDMTPAQLTLSWVRAKQPSFLPLVGVRNRAQVDDALGALEKPLPPNDIAALDALVPAQAIAGPRYAAAQMAHLDSER
jgi:aryl-alcohol dehydrogenase-like predicted oxidoreductase